MALLLAASLIYLNTLITQSDKPNIIFILTDDWGINDAGWTNENTDIQTPFLDNLAKTDSVILSNYYAQKVCTATRTAFLTGRYPQRVGLQNGVFHQNQPFSLTRQVSMLSNELQSNGYKTHIIGYCTYFFVIHAIHILYQNYSANGILVINHGNIRLHFAALIHFMDIGMAERHISVTNHPFIGILMMGHQ